jgi:hypothetical protein
MSVEYPRRFPRTRRQLVWQCAVSALVLLPPLVWRLTSEPVVVSLALGGLALLPTSLSYRGVRFLAVREEHHPQPTAEMTFVFTLVSLYPLAASAFLLILLAEM